MTDFVQLDFGATSLRVLPGDGSQVGSLVVLLVNPKQKGEIPPTQVSDRLTLHEESYIPCQIIRPPGIGGGGMHEHTYFSLCRLVFPAQKIRKPSALSFPKPGVYVLPDDHRPYTQQMVMVVDDTEGRLYTQELSGHTSMTGAALEGGEIITIPPAWDIYRSAVLSCAWNEKEKFAGLKGLFCAIAADSQCRNQALDLRCSAPFEDVIQGDIGPFERWGAEI